MAAPAKPPLINRQTSKLGVAVEHNARRIIKCHMRVQIGVSDMLCLGTVEDNSRSFSKDYGARNLNVALFACLDDPILADGTQPESAFDNKVPACGVGNE